jgi:PTH1 family peptidyl-tRNA hydrolase
LHLVVGLGNPGRQYEQSRHNVGFRCVDELARRMGLTFARRAFQALVVTVRMDGQRVMLAKPQTYMNLSGDAVGPLIRYYGLSPDYLLSIYDDLDLPLGRIRIRERGSSGGHKGIASIIEAIGTDAFPRLRIGIGRPAGVEAASYVLGRFTPDEEPTLAEVINRAADAVGVIVREGVTVAMNRYNA